MIFELLLLMAGTAHPLVPFAGTVVDDEGTPLEGVVVSVDGEDLLPSDPDGQFGPARLTPGHHRLVASVGEFRSYAMDLAIESHRPALDYPLRLDLSLIRGHRPWIPDSPNVELPIEFQTAAESIDGCWATPARDGGAVLNLRRLPSGDYEATYQSGGCLAHWELHRHARYSEGTLLFDYPLRQYVAGTFQHLYVTEINGEQYMVSPAQVPEFLKQLPTAAPYGIRWYSGYLLKRDSCR